MRRLTLHLVHFGVSTPSKVTAPLNTDIDDLKKLVRERVKSLGTNFSTYPAKLVDLDADLYEQLQEPVLVDPEDGPDKRAKLLGTKFSTLTRRLSSAEKMAQVFPTQPNEIQLQILVQHPDGL
jgi:hypothetical protein